MELQTNHFYHAINVFQYYLEYLINYMLLINHLDLI